MLITEEMVRSMKKGSVIVDLAAENGGNCALTQPGAVVERHGVHIVGYVDLPSRLAPTATQLYGSNLAHLLAEMGGAKSFHVDLEDEVVRGAAGGPGRRGDVAAAAAKKPAPAARGQAAPRPPPAPAPGRREAARGQPGRASALARWRSPRSLARRRWSALGLVAPPGFLSHLTVFALACVVGWQVIWNVTPALHTPLMSVTNAISGIIVVGRHVAGQRAGLDSPVVRAGRRCAILLATINVAGGFLVTQRMLRMFRK